MFDFVFYVYLIRRHFFFFFFKFYTYIKNKNKNKKAKIARWKKKYSEIIYIGLIQIEITANSYNQQVPLEVIRPKSCTK